MDLQSSTASGIEVNGHFCPTTLSIYETVGYPEEDSLNFEDLQFDSLESLRDAVRKRAEQIPDDKLLTSLISIHEHDHFLRFVSTELGLLMHMAMLIRYCAICSLLSAMSAMGRRMSLEEVCSRFPQMIPAANDYVRTSRIYNVLWLGDTGVSQQVACADINWLIETLGGQADTVMPDNPDAPAGFGWGMLHLLEASAVMSEEVLLENLEVPPDRKEQLLRRNERDHSLYFEMRNWVTEPLGSTILGLIAVRMAFEGCVTGLIYNPPHRPVPYHNFHPCFFLSELRGALTALFDGEKPEPTPQIQNLHFSQHTVLNRLYSDLSGIAAKLGQCGMFKFECAKPMIRSFEDLLARLTVDDHSGMGLLLTRSARPTLSYWIDSHERLRQKRLEYPEHFILPHVWATPFRRDRKYFQDPCATFTMLEGRGITSHSFMQTHRLEKDSQFARLQSVFNAIGMRFRLEVVDQAMGGTELPKAIAGVAHNFKWAMPVGGEYFDEVMTGSVEHLREMLGGLD